MHSDEELKARQGRDVQRAIDAVFDTLVDVYREAILKLPAGEAYVFMPALSRAVGQAAALRVFYKALVPDETRSDVSYREVEEKYMREYGSKRPELLAWIAAKLETVLDYARLTAPIFAHEDIHRTFVMKGYRTVVLRREEFKYAEAANCVFDMFLHNLRFAIERVKRRLLYD